MSNIVIEVVPAKDDQWGVNVTLPNGRGGDCRFSGDHDQAYSYALGVQQGLMLAMNAIGFVPSPISHKRN